MTLIFPLIHVHADRGAGQFTVIPFACDPDGLSVTIGNFLTFGWEEFRAEGYKTVKRCLTEYRTGYKEGLSQFDKLSESDRVRFYAKNNIGYQISEREADLWWISLMEPVARGSHVLPIGPRARIKFQPSREGNRFFDVLLQLVAAQ